MEFIWLKKKNLVWCIVFALSLIGMMRPEFAVADGCLAVQGHDDLCCLYDEDDFTGCVQNGVPIAEKKVPDACYDFRDQNDDIIYCDDAMIASGLQSGGHTCCTVKIRKGARNYYLYIPKSYDGQNPVPLVVYIHGLFDTAEWDFESTRWAEVAEREGFIVIFPQGYKNSWNGEKCCGHAQIDELDDKALIMEMIEDVAQKAQIDRRRIYVTGHSNGAFMSHLLALSYPEHFAAIAPLSGPNLLKESDPEDYPNLFEQPYDNWVSSHGMPVISFMGFDDENISFWDVLFGNVYNTEPGYSEGEVLSSSDCQFYQNWYAAFELLVMGEDNGTTSAEADLIVDSLLCDNSNPGFRADFKNWGRANGFTATADTGAALQCLVEGENDPIETYFQNSGGKKIVDYYHLDVDHIKVFENACGNHGVHIATRIWNFFKQHALSNEAPVFESSTFECVTDTNTHHKAAGRAYAKNLSLWTTNYYAKGTDFSMKTGASRVTSLMQMAPGVWFVVDNCDN